MSIDLKELFNKESNAKHKSIKYIELRPELTLFVAYNMPSMICSLDKVSRVCRKEEKPYKISKELLCTNSSTAGRIEVGRIYSATSLSKEQKAEITKTLKESVR